MEEHFKIQDKIFDVLYVKYDYKNPFFNSLKNHYDLSYNELYKPIVYLHTNYGVRTTNRYKYIY